MKINDIPNIYTRMPHNRNFNEDNTFDYTDTNFSRWQIRKMIHSTLYDHQPLKKAKGISKISLGNTQQLYPDEIYMGRDKDRSPDLLVRDESKRVQNLLPRNRFPETNKLMAKTRNISPAADPYSSIKWSVTEERRLSSQTP